MHFKKIKKNLLLRNKDVIFRFKFKPFFKVRRNFKIKRICFDTLTANNLFSADYLY